MTSASRARTHSSTHAPPQSNFGAFAYMQSNGVVDGTMWHLKGMGDDIQIGLINVTPKTHL